MTNLTTRQTNFVRLMAKGEEHRRKGFRLLKDQADRATYFDELARSGFFGPTENPGPTPVKTSSGSEGAVRIPYWDALGYLVECAREAGRRDDLALAEKVLGVVRATVRYRDGRGEPTDNYHTNRECAEILGLVPLWALIREDFELVSELISSHYERDGAAIALDKGLVEKLLKSEHAEHWKLATRVLEQLLVWRWESRNIAGLADEEPMPAVDGYWLSDILARRASQLGLLDGPGISTLLRNRVIDLFSRGARRRWSYLSRAAVEEHAQNSDHRFVEGAVVGGLRDAVLAWAGADEPAATPFVSEMLYDDTEMVRRIGIFVVAEHWGGLADLFERRLDLQLFTIGHHHELFALIEKRFDVMTESVKETTLRVIRSVALSDPDSAEEERDWGMLRWLWALERTSYGPAQGLLAEVSARRGARRPEHPDFLSYGEVSWGYGPSPHSVPTIVGLALNRALKDAIQEFQPQHRMDGPTMEAFTLALEQAATEHPREMLVALPGIEDLAPQYVSCILRGFKVAWEKPEARATAGWWTEKAWPQLMQVMTAVVRTRARLVADGDGPTEWLLAMCVDLLRAGVRTDEHAYPEVLLESGWSILLSITALTKPIAEAPQDPMSHAINATRGKALEGVIEQVLRECRIADRDAGQHLGAWEMRVAFFDSERARLPEGNFEFATLIGAYFANLEYMSPSWCEQVVPELFSPRHSEIFRCAVSGLAHARPTRSSYSFLRDAGVLERAMKLEHLPDRSRSKIVERILLGYMWDVDTLDSPRLRSMFGESAEDDLAGALWFLKRAGKENLTSPQREKLFAFWHATVRWASEQVPPASKVLTRSAGLATYVDSASGPGLDLLLSVAPFVGHEFAFHEFADELARLVEGHPAEVARILERVVATGGPDYDHEGRLVHLLERLADRGQRAQVLEFCNRLHEIPGVADLYRRLTRQN